LDGQGWASAALEPRTIAAAVIAGYQQDFMSRLLHRPRHSPASVPIPKFANLCGTLQCELRNQKGH
jgi:hypothetical protein